MLAGEECLAGCFMFFRSYFLNSDTLVGFDDKY